MPDSCSRMISRNMSVSSLKCFRGFSWFFYLPTGDIPQDLASPVANLAHTSPRWKLLSASKSWWTGHRAPHHRFPSIWWYFCHRFWNGEVYHDVHVRRITNTTYSSPRFHPSCASPALRHKSPASSHFPRTSNSSMENSRAQPTSMLDWLTSK